MSIARNCWSIVILAVGVFLSGCATKSPATPPAAGYLAIEAINIKSVIPDPPADTSPAARAELDHLLAIQGKRTPADVARIKAEGPLSSTFAVFQAADGGA